MRTHVKSTMLAAAAGLLCGCTPQVTFSRLSSSDNLADPGHGDYVFALRKSSILVGPRPTKPDDGRDRQVADAVVACAQPEECRNQILVVAAPEVDEGAIYKVHVGLGTGLTITPVDTQPLLPQKVVQTYTKRGSKMLASVGQGAATGYAFGPWGAVVGAAAGALGGGWNALIFRVPSKVSSQTLTLNLPLSIDTVISTDTPTLPPDWQPLPNSIDGRSNPNWQYRLVRREKTARDSVQAIPVIFGSATPAGPVFLPASELEVTSTHDSPTVAEARNRVAGKWPVAACRAVSLEMRVKNGGRWTAIDPFALTVADPTYAQLLTLTSDGRTIVYGAVCGGYATSSPSEADPVGAELVKQAAAFKKAKKDYGH